MWQARCWNVACKDELNGKLVLCTSCRTIGAAGIFVGGVIVGILLKIFG